MMIDEYELPSEFQHLMAASENLSQLFKGSDKPSSLSPVKLRVWRAALSDAAFNFHFSRPDWPLEMLAAFPSGEVWRWQAIESRGNTRIAEGADIINAVRAAAGIDKPPATNIHLSLLLRAYDEHDSHIGSLPWWKKRAFEISAVNGFGRAFISCLLRCLSRALDAGSELHVERMSIILAKAKDTKIATLSPTLHVDMHYGAHEAVVASILEHGWEGLGGTLFMPTCNMGTMRRFGPMTLKTVQEKLARYPLVRTAGGDVSIYDGMIGTDQKRHRENGIPHISPDSAGLNARLGILMRHRRLL